MASGEELPADEELRTVGTRKGEEDKNITVVNAQNMTVKSKLRNGRFKIQKIRF